MPQQNDDSNYLEVWQEESWTAHGGQPDFAVTPMYVDVCVFVDGKHLYPGTDCPHYNGIDDSEFKRGWTVLNN